MTDFLPPGNTPAWADADPANQIAQIWAQDMWPVLWPRMLPAYDNAAARDADLTGLGPSDVAFAFLKDKKVATYWTGSAWKLLAPATGQTTVAFNASGIGTLTHNLGITGIVQATPLLTTTFVLVAQYTTTPPTANTVTLKAMTDTGGAYSGNVVVNWSIS